MRLKKVSKERDLSFCNVLNFTLELWNILTPVRMVCFHMCYRMEYLTAKMSKAEDAEKGEIQNQITLLEKDIAEIRFI